jgi:acyl carrier protein
VTKFFRELMMSTDKQLIRDFFIELRDPNTKVGDDESLLATGLLDSLAMVQLLAFIESQFHVTVDDDDLAPENFETINAIVKFVNSKVG